MPHLKDAPSISSSSADRCGKILGTNPDFFIVFETISDNVEMPLKVMVSLVLQSLPAKRLDSVVGSNLESLADPSAIRKEKAPLGIAAFADDAFEDFPVVRSPPELESDFEHVVSFFAWVGRWSNRLRFRPFLADLDQLGVWWDILRGESVSLCLPSFPKQFEPFQ